MFAFKSDTPYDLTLPFAKPGIGVAGFSNYWSALQLAAADGDPVTSIPNLVPGGAPLTVPAGATAPTYKAGAKPVISFNGVSNRLSATTAIPGPFTLVLAYKMKSPVGAIRYITESGGTLFRMSATGLLNDSAGNVSGAAVPPDAFALLMLVRDAATSRLVVNTSETLNAFAANTAHLNNPLFGGAATPTASELACAITFPRALTLAERDTLRTTIPAIFIP